MQEVSAAFTAEERDTVRNVTADLLVSWKKESTLGSVTFTIGVSTIGGNDIIGIIPGAIGSPGNYKYFDESDYLLGLSWERGLNMPLGGLTKALAEADLENTTGRFTPRYMGGSSELFTAILPRRPFIINAGFEVEGISQNIPQFAGVLTRQPKVDVRSDTVRLVGSDYIDYFENRYLDRELMFTGQRTDQVIETLFQSMGMSTAQYELDVGINTIPFGLFEKGTTFSYLLDKLVQSEYGHLYQDEQGIFRFENRQHWDSSPHNSVSSIIYTADVLGAEVPDEDHIINVIEVKSSVRAKQPLQLVFSLSSPIFIPAGEEYTLFTDFDDPMLSIEEPNILGNTLEDGTGTDLTITLRSSDEFARAAKYVFVNNNAQDAYITDMTVYGRPARVQKEIYIRSQDDSSLTAFEERPLSIDNPYVQSEDWAESLSQMILNDYSEVGNIQIITIRAKPSLQLGDLISWQGRHWRIYWIRSRLDPSEGFTQELTLLQRDVVSYFRIGISTIGGDDQIAP